MGSEIGNKAILKNIANWLGIRDVKQAPGELDVSSGLKLTQDLMAGGYNGYLANLASTGSVAINGVSSRNDFIAGVRAGSASIPLVATSDQEARILSLNATLVFDAAGAAAFAAAQTRVNLRLALVRKDVGSDSTAGSYIVNLSPWCIPLSGRTVYEFALGCFRTQDQLPTSDPATQSYAVQPAPWKGWVPADFFARLELATFGAVNFPANTTYQVDTVVIRQGRGVRLPM